MVTHPSPILVFTYKRLEPLRKTIEALKNNPISYYSDLYIFSDAAKNPSDEKIVSQVREYIKTITGFNKIKVTEAESNKGLANSIIGGVTEVLKFSETVIVLEDDLITTPNFLSFMNKSLQKYKGDQQVFSISGYSFDLGEKEDSEDAYFLNRGWSWGWATWKSRWEKVDWQVQDYQSFRRDKQKRREFARGGSDLNKMLREQMEGCLDSWAIRWFYAQFKLGGLTLYPVRSKVLNNGFDASATHTNGSDKRYRPLLDQKHSEYFNFPENLIIDPYYYAKFRAKMGIRARVVSRLDSLFLKFRAAI